MWLTSRVNPSSRETVAGSSFAQTLQGFRPDDSFNRPDGGLFFLGPFALKRAPLIRHCGTSPDQFQQQQIASIPPISQQFDIPWNLQDRVLVVPGEVAGNAQQPRP